MKRLPYEPARILIKCTFGWVLVISIPKALGLIVWENDFGLPMIIVNWLIVAVFSASTLYSLVAIFCNANRDGLTLRKTGPLEPNGPITGRAGAEKQTEQRFLRSG